MFTFTLPDADAAAICVAEQPRRCRDAEDTRLRRDKVIRSYYTLQHEEREEKERGRQDAMPLFTLMSVLPRESDSAFCPFFDVCQHAP